MAQPRNVKAEKKDLDYLGKKARRHAQKRPRKFRTSAAMGGPGGGGGGKLSINTTWLNAPLQKTNVPPVPESTAAELPTFCGGPPVDQGASIPNKQIQARTLTWKAFQKAMRQNHLEERLLDQA